MWCNFVRHKSTVPEHIPLWNRKIRRRKMLTYSMMRPEFSPCSRYGYPSAQVTWRERLSVRVGKLLTAVVHNATLTTGFMGCGFLRVTGTGITRDAMNKKGWIWNMSLKIKDISGNCSVQIARIKSPFPVGKTLRLRWPIYPTALPK